jgi:CheY-like chemotaxis protein/MinD-like ATPase involved in chromosome partitioning or flagellar assembly
MAEKILIVDDDQQTVHLVELMLSRKGYEVINAVQGADALNQAQTKKPDLIILDVMMPDMDGFQVARRLREMPETAAIPIIMFTARTQLEDKVKGYEAGADGYLTKPIHPAELAANVKALLARGKPQVSPQPEETLSAGHCIAVISPRGGLGASSLTLNLSMALFKATKMDIIAAELQPGHGTWALDLSLPNADGLSNLLEMPLENITPATVKERLIKTKYGPSYLPASDLLKDFKLVNAIDPLRKIIKTLTTLAPIVLLDYGIMMIPDILSSLALSGEILIITEPFPAAARQTQILIEQIRQNLGENHLLTVVAINRTRSEMQLTAAQLEENLGVPVSIFIPPAPEIAYQAGLRSMPLSVIQPESLLTQQYDRLAKEFAQRIAPG